MNGVESREGVGVTSSAAAAADSASPAAPPRPRRAPQWPRPWLRAGGQ